MRYSYTFPTLIFFLLLSLIGFAFLPMVPNQLKPQTNQPSISVGFHRKNASSKSVEQEVTSILEGALNQVKGVKEITSSSEVGRGNISLSFVEDTDMQLAAYEVSAMVCNVYRSLPEGVSYPWINVGGSNPDDRPVLVYALLTPPQQPELPGKLREQLENKLQHWPGIKQVSVYGGQSLQWRLTYQLEKIQALGISESDFRSALGLTNLREPLGRLDQAIAGSGEQMGAVLRSPYQKDWQWQQAKRKGTGSKEDV